MPTFARNTLLINERQARLALLLMSLSVAVRMNIGSVHSLMNCFIAFDIVAGIIKHLYRIKATKGSIAEIKT